MNRVPVRSEGREFVKNKESLEGIHNPIVVKISQKPTTLPKADWTFGVGLNQSKKKFDL